MAMIFELITMLAVLPGLHGRIWEIRREIRRSQRVAHLHHVAEAYFADQPQTGYRLPTAYL
jgi:hypothetical protein